MTRYVNVSFRRNYKFSSALFVRIARAFFTIMEITKTDLQKTIAYLEDAAKLYDALPMLAMKCRAHMIRQLTAKLRLKLEKQ